MKKSGPPADPPAHPTSVGYEKVVGGKSKYAVYK